MTFKRVNDFSTENPVMLDRELSQLESNIADQFNELDKTVAKSTNVSSFFSLSPNTVVPLMVDEQRSIDTTQGNAIAVLPALDPTNFGRRFVVIKRSASNAISVTCSDTAAQINAAAFPLSITAVGARVIYCDQTGYYT